MGALSVIGKVLRKFRVSFYFFIIVLTSVQVGGGGWKRIIPSFLASLLKRDSSFLCEISIFLAKQLPPTPCTNINARIVEIPVPPFPLHFFHFDDGFANIFLSADVNVIFRAEFSMVQQSTLTSMERSINKQPSISIRTPFLIHKILFLFHFI